MERLRQVYRIVVKAASAWFEDGAMSMAAAIAFYTTFSLAPIVILVTAFAGIIFGEQAAQGAIADQIEELVGPAEAQTVQTLVASARSPGASTLAGIFGIGVLIIGATTVFGELQAALNRIWRVEPPNEALVTWLVKARLKGLALVGAIGFLLIVSLTISTALGALTTLAKTHLPEGAALFWMFDLVVSWFVFAVLFAAVFRVLPDTHIPWRDVALGAAITSLLFLIGKFLISLYLSTAGVASTYGAAGSFVVILLWVYYSASVFLFGAEVTRFYSEHLGSRTGRNTSARQAAAE